MFTQLCRQEAPVKRRQSGYSLHILFFLFLGRKGVSFGIYLFKVMHKAIVYKEKSGMKKIYNLSTYSSVAVKALLLEHGRCYKNGL